MTKVDPTQELEFDDESDEQDVGEPLPRGSIAAVVSGTDWTAETIVSQLQRGNIQLNPRFQRRDAWKRDRKSRFIESLIVGLPTYARHSAKAVPTILDPETEYNRVTALVQELVVLEEWLVKCKQSIR